MSANKVREMARKLKVERDKVEADRAAAERERDQSNKRRRQGAWDTLVAICKEAAALGLSYETRRDESVGEPMIRMSHGDTEWFITLREAYEDRSDPDWGNMGSHYWLAEVTIQHIQAELDRDFKEEAFECTINAGREWFAKFILDRWPKLIK